MILKSVGDARPIRGDGDRIVGGCGRVLIPTTIEYKSLTLEQCLVKQELTGQSIPRLLC